MLDLAPQAITVGFFTGLAYALLAAGLVLVYRATRVINFAHGQTGALAASVLVLLVERYGWPYLPALLVTVAVGGATGLAIEAGVIRRLASQSRLVLLVATIGVTQVVLVVQILLPDVPGARFPVPIDRSMKVGSVLLLGEHFLALAAAPAVIVALALLMKTPYGLAIRAVAGNPDAASLAGINIRRISVLVWIVAGVLSALTAVLITPLRGTVGAGIGIALGPGLLLRALGAGLIGGMVNLPRALIGGVGIGILEALLFTNYPTTPGIVDALLFVAILGMLLARRDRVVGDDRGAWSLPGVVRRPAPAHGPTWVRNLRPNAMRSAAALAVLVPVVVTTSSGLFLWTRVVVFALAALSVTVLTGWAGQLSLAQYAFVGVGAVATGALTDRGVPFGAAVGYSVVAGVIIAIAVGLPALRLHGLFLAVTTLGFAVAAHGYLFRQSWLLPGGQATVAPGELGPFKFASARTYYYFCLIVLALALWSMTRLRRTGIGRALIAVQDNETGAAAFSVSPTVAKLTAFALAGGLASLGGGLLAGLMHQYTSADFGPDASLQVISIAIIGGIATPVGAVVGAVYVLGVPALLGATPAVNLATSGIGLLALLLFRPGGLVSVLDSIHDRVVRRFAGDPALEGSDVDPTPAPSFVRSTTKREVVALHDQPAVSTRDVSVSFGGRLALDSVSIEARPGEVVGLIGANGAGKSTLMNVISGFQPARGTVEIFGIDVSGLEPHERARAGVGRAFQSATLFGNLTVAETIALALEVHDRSELVPSLLSLPPSSRAERRKVAATDELIDLLGLGRYWSSPIAHLSTGTRRIVELACLLGMEAKVLLLDEPTAGVAQREAEAFGPLILRIREQLGATVLVIEHDISLVMSMSDRIYCLEAGLVIAEGEPEEIRHDPAVIASYLGTDDRAILRSGSGT